jgi:hypothetical protein
VILVKILSMLTIFHSLKQPETTKSNNKAINQNGDVIHEKAKKRKEEVSVHNILEPTIGLPSSAVASRMILQSYFLL